MSDDCSINISLPPPMYGIPDKGLCDLTKRRCVGTSVLGENFIASSSLLCNVKSFQVQTLENHRFIYIVT